MWWDLAETEEGVRRQSIRELIPKVIPYFVPHRKLLYAGLSLLIPVTAASLAPGLILQYLIDVVIRSGDFNALIKWTIALVGIIVIGAALAYVQAVILFRLGITIITGIKAKLFDHVLRLGLDFHETHPPGKLLSRVESDTETVRELFGDVAVNLLRNFLMFISILVVLVYKNFYIAAWILLIVPILFVSVFIYLNYMRKFYREFRAQWAIVIGFVTEYVQGIDVIQLFNYQKPARERMHDINLGKYKVEAPMFFLEYGFWGLFWFGEIIALMIIVVIGFRQIAEGTLTVGVMILFFEFIRQLYFPMIQLSEQLNFVQRSLISVERVFGILETEPSIKNGSSPPEELKFEKEIRFENVWFAYEEENWILRDVSFSIPKGTRIALVGSSGGGKSTVVNLLLRFYDPQKGRITVDGRDIRDFPVTAWRDLIGLVLQDIFLFPGSVADNLRVFDQSVPIDRVKKVAEIAHADKIIEKLPGGFDGELAERGSNLSVGERQLLSFARALTFDPPILILDEATSSVDPHTERLVQEALDRLLAGRTAVIVAHRLSTILNSDLILLVQNGEIVEHGSHEELLEANGVYAKLFHLQFEEVWGNGDNRVGGVA